MDWKRNEAFFGFRGLDYSNFYLYRVLRPGENTGERIACKDPTSDRDVEKHIASGSKKDSRFISTTLDSKVAARWAFYEMETPAKRGPRDEPRRIVKIDIQRLVGTDTEKNCINLCDEEVREHFVKGAMDTSRVKSSREVLFQYEIPKYVSKADKISCSTPQPTQYLLPGQNFLQAGTTCSSNPCRWDSYDDKELVYWTAKDVPKPSQPPPKTPKKEKRSLEEDN